MIYAANQMVSSWMELLQIYLHPKMLDVFSIPFFRPSGHFLMYQLLAPWLGWQNTQAFIIVNLFFLALSGYLFIQVYALLFPGLWVGGFLAFSFYLMHPDLMLSRLIVLHFEFAYVFFTLLSFYCFLRFCHNEKKEKIAFLLASLLFYVLAVTFKEPALMLGPVLAVYYCLSTPRLFSKQSFQVCALLTIVTLCLLLYLTLAWPSLTHPLGGAITSNEKWAASDELLRQFLGLASVSSVRSMLHQSHLIWRELIFTPPVKIIIWIFVFLAFAGSIKLGWEKNKEQSLRKKKLLFLWIATFLFLILPVNWAMGLPWHISLSLVFFSLIAGFGAEFLAIERAQAKAVHSICGIILAVLVGLMTIPVNKANVDYLRSRNGFALQVARNAVLHPPVIHDQLGPATLLLVEDSLLHDSYALGNSEYPLFLKADLNFDELEKVQAFSFLKHQPLYNGYLFKWAYLQPLLHEEVYPFRVEQLNTVPDAVIYSWLQHYQHLVCLGYDEQAHWHDRSALLKQQLLREKAKRFLRVNSYTPFAATLLQGRILYTKTLSLPDPQLCQYECDQNVQCKGFTYENAHYHYHSTVKCQFYDALLEKQSNFCATCIGFVKIV